ncbi:MAG: hypothetical protein P8Y70_15060 [Candidatus Lokiarchaeota archaeon]
MTKISDAVLVLLFIGTVVTIISLFIWSIILPETFIYLQVTGWISIIVSIIFGFVNQNKFHVLKLIKRFPLKLDRLIVLVSMSILFISFLSFIDVLNFIYTGKITYFALSWSIFIVGISGLSYYRKKQKAKLHEKPIQKK